MSQEAFPLFVTSLNVEHQLLLVWGQRDPGSASLIEEGLTRHVSLNARMAPSDLSMVFPGLKCFAYNADGKFYRACVKSVMTCLVQLHSLDFGFEFCVDFRNLRIPMSDDPILKLPDEASCYYIAGLVTKKELNRNELTLLEQGIVFTQLVAKIVAGYENSPQFALFYKGHYDIRETMLQTGFVTKVQLTHQERIVLLNHKGANSVGRVQPVPVNVPPPQVLVRPPPTTPFLVQPSISPAAAASDDLLMNSELIKKLAFEVKGQMGLSAPPTEGPNFTPPLRLRQGTTYNVVVSDISDGPWSFSVQLVNDLKLLDQVADEMQKTDKVFLRPPIFPGKTCIAYYAAKNLYARGLIVKVGHHLVGVTFIDYGGTADLSLKEVFELPSYGFRIQTLCQQFCLSQLPQFKWSKEDMAEIRECFSEIVSDKVFLLKVTTTEEDCMQNCEMYDAGNNSNVKHAINMKVKQMKMMYLADVFPEAGVNIDAFVTHVDSPTSFFIQNREREEEATTMLNSLQEIAKTAGSVPNEELLVGFPCLALFSDGLWYRARITQLTQDGATAFFVDYGNTETVSIDSIKELPRKFLLKHKTMALACCLEGFEDAHSDQKVTEKLVELTNELGVSLKVVELHPARMIVRVLKDGSDILLPPPMAKTAVQPVTQSVATSPSAEDNWRYPESTSTYESPRESHPIKFGRRDERHDGGRRNSGRDVGRDSYRNEGRGSKRHSGRFSDRGSKNGRRSSAQGFAGSGRFSHRNDDENGSFKKRFDKEDGGFKKRFENGDGGGFKKRFDKEDGGGFTKRFDNEDGGGFKKRFGNEDGGGYKKRFDGEDGGGYKKRFESEDGGGYKKRFESEDGGGYKKRFESEDGGGYKKRFESEDGGGFKKRFDNEDGGGYKKRFDNENGGGFKKFDNDNGDGFKRRFDNEDGGGFRKKFDDGDGSSRPMRQPIRNEDRAPPGSVFEDQAIESGSTLDVTITYFVSPLDFYIQTSTHKDAFVSLMETMQTDYVNKFGIRKTDIPQETDILVAKFYEDRVLYRAEVTLAEPLTVRFVDYGNTEAIKDTRDVYPVMKKLLDVPKQAVRCALDGVQPAEGDNWSMDASNYFEKEQLSCTFISENDGLYRVCLTSDGKQLAAELIAAGVAKPVGQSEEQAAAPQETIACQDDNSTESRLSRITTPMISLLPGQKLLATVPYIEGVDKFFAHLHSQSVLEMEALIADLFKEPMACVAVDSAKLVPDFLCIAGLSAEARYRARVLEITDEGCWVNFIDYGDSAEVPLSEIFEMPEPLKCVRPLAVECGLSGDTSNVTDETQDTFKEDFEQKTVILDVSLLENESVKVILYDNEGKKVAVQEGVNDAPTETSIPDLPLIASEMNLNVIELTGPSTALVSLPGTSEPDIDSFYTESKPNGEVLKGSPCAVKCSDGRWRRAVRSGSEEVYLVDVGRKEQASTFYSLARSLRQPAAVRQVQITWPVLGETNVRVRHEDIGFVIEPVTKKVFITHVETANELYAYAECVAAKLDEVQLAIAELSASDLPNDDLFAARFPDDEQWYRARLETRDPLRVRFIDYGNASEVTEVAPLPPGLLVTPPLAVPIHLKADLPENAKAVLEELAATAESPLTVIEEGGYVVDLLHNCSSVVARLQGRLPLTVGATVYMSHADSPSKLFLQREEDSALLETLNERLASAESFPPVADPSGILVAAKFSEDEAWYRGRIENDQVWFLDHGNRAEISEVRELPTDLAEIPPLAQRAALVHPAGRTWSDAASEVLVEFLDGRPLVVKELTVRGGIYVVTLTDFDTDVATVLELGATACDSVATVSDDVAGDLPDASGSADGAEWPGRGFSEQTTDDHKSGALRVTDDERAERNETDEQKRGKMEGPRSDDEKGDSAGNVNVPDSELEQDIITGMVADLVNEAIPTVSIVLQQPIDETLETEHVAELVVPIEVAASAATDVESMTETSAVEAAVRPEIETLLETFAPSEVELLLDTSSSEDPANETSDTLLDDYQVEESPTHVKKYEVTPKQAEESTTQLEQDVASELGDESRAQLKRDEASPQQATSDSTTSYQELPDVSSSPSSEDHESSLASAGSADTVPATEEYQALDLSSMPTEEYNMSPLTTESSEISQPSEEPTSEDDNNTNVAPFSDAQSPAIEEQTTEPTPVKEATAIVSVEKPSVVKIVPGISRGTDWLNRDLVEVADATNGANHESGTGERVAFNEGSSGSQEEPLVPVNGDVGVITAVHSVKASATDKIVPGSINRGIDLSNGNSH